MKNHWKEWGGLEESSNACDISGVTSPIAGSAIGSFTDGARGCGKYKG